MTKEAGYTIYQKATSFFSLFSLFLQITLPLTYAFPAYAQEAIVEPTLVPTPEPTTIEQKPTLAPEPTLEATVAPTQEPTVEPTAVPTIEVSPTIAVEASPTAEISPTMAQEASPSPEISPVITETPVISQTPSENTSPAPTSEAQSTPAATETPAMSMLTPTPEPTLGSTPTVTTTPTEGHVDTTLVESYSCRSDSLNGCLISDKADYAPTDVALITGYGFLPNTQYVLHITSSDQPEVNFQSQITSNEQGSFSYSYQLDGNYRPNYSVNLTDLSGVTIASTTFTDSRNFDFVRVNGSSTTTVNSSGNVVVDVQLDTTGSNEANDWESTRYTIQGQPSVCDNTPNYTSAGTNRTSTYTLTAPLAAGTYDLTTTAFSDNNCTNESNTLVLTNAITVAISYSADTFDSNTYSTPKSTYTIGETVYGKGTRSSAANIRLRYLNPSNSTVLTCNYVNSTSTTCDYPLPYDAPAGTWKIQLGRCDSSCGNNNNWTWTGYAEDTFTVQTVPFTSTYICHSTNGTNSYVSVPANTIGQFMGHVGNSHQNGNDIIPPLTGLLPSGQNWTTQNQIIWNNNCAPVVPGHLIVQKTTVPANDPTQFTILATGSGTITGNATATISDSTDKNYEVAPGTYSVTETVPTGWTKTGDTCQNIVITSGQTVTCLITNTKLGSVSVVKDSHPNDTQNFIFTLTDGNSVQIGTTELDDDGNNNSSRPNNHTFNNLLPGSYSITENSVSGWYLNSVSCTGASSYTTDIPNRKVNFTITSGQTPSCTFNNYQYGRIEGEKYNDKDGDNNQDNGEEDLSGWTIFIDQNSNSQLDNGEQSDLTDSGGNYSFNNLTAGTYRVCEVQQDGWYSSLPNQATCQTTTLNSDGGDEDELNFANHQDAKIRAYKIVCDKESDLPNWGNGAPSITSSTAQNYLNSHPTCHLESGWTFQYGLNGQVSRYGSGDQLGSAPSPWQTLGTTNGSNPAEVSISNLQNSSGVWVREVLQANYVPFTYPEQSSNSFSAEIYCHTDGERYDNFDQVSSIRYGSTYYCVAFNALNQGKLSVYKYQDYNANGVKDEQDSLLGNWDILATPTSGSAITQTTDESGKAEFNLIAGTYNLNETLKPNWYQSSITCDNQEQNKVSQETTTGKQITISPGENMTCYIGNYQKATITINKDVVDFNGNEISDNTTFTVSSGESYGEKSFSEESSASFLVNPGTYTFSETNLDSKYTVKNINNCDGQILETSNIAAESGRKYCLTFTNQKVKPVLNISKTNNRPDSVSTGSEIQYTLALNVSANDINDVVVVDLPPFGIKYKSGSFSATKNGVNFPITEPVYSSPGKWYLGNLNIGDTVVLNYLATVDSYATPGIYKDLAYAFGCANDSESDCTTGNSDKVLALADIGKLSDNYVGTQVGVLANASSKDTNIIREEKVSGSVLGATTSLPATGSNNLWLILSFTFSLLGLSLLFIRKKMLNITAILVFALAFVVPGKSFATETPSNLYLRIEEPKSPSILSQFPLDFTSMDQLNRALTVKCYVVKPDNSTVQLGSDIAIKAGGNSGQCTMGSFSLSEDNKTYKFYAVATVDSESFTSDQVSVLYDNKGPDTPSYQGKENVSLCHYKIKFKAANDGQTVEIRVYRSTETSFSANSSNQVASIGLSPDQEGSYTDNIPDNCNKDYYYGIRAFDASGNGSDVVGDTKTITVVTSTVSTGTVLGSQAGAIPVRGVVLGKKDDSMGKNAQPTLEPKTTTSPNETSGTVLGQQTVVHKITNTLGKLLIPALFVVGILLLGYGFKKRKDQN